MQRGSNSIHSVVMPVLALVLLVSAVPAATDEPLEQAALLKRRLPEVRLESTALTDVIDFCRDLSGANLWVDWKALERAGIDRDTPVTLQARSLPLSRLLDLVTAEASKPDAKVGWALTDGVITITTAANLRTSKVTRAYDVRPLATLRTGAGPSTRPAAAADPLIALITGSIDPGQWSARGGADTLEERDGQLIITTTEANHILIDNAIDQLRRMASAK